MGDPPSRHASTIDASQLAARVRARRQAKGLSVRAAAKELGMSAATISRVESGSHLPERDHLLRLTDWANVELRLAREQRTDDVHPSDASTIEAIELHLRADKDLKPKDAELLVQLVRTAMDTMSRQTE